MTKSPRLLIVEDDYLLLEIVSALCERHGVEVMAASRGEAALTLLRRHGREIDWLLIDLGLRGPIASGALAAYFRGLQPTRPVIFAASAIASARKRHPHAIFVHKPFQAREIATLARMMAGQAAPAARLRAAG